MPLEEARHQFEVNLFGPARLIQLVLPHMRAQRSGRILNVSSMGGEIAFPLGAWYHASKHALEGYSDALRQEVKRGIDVVLIQPGITRTEFGDVTVRAPT
jgi:short-subunit dehydrogenase